MKNVKINKHLSFEDRCTIEEYLSNNFNASFTCSSIELSLFIFGNIFLISLGLYPKPFKTSINSSKSYIVLVSDLGVNLPFRSNIINYVLACIALGLA